MERFKLNIEEVQSMVDLLFQKKHLDYRSYSIMPLKFLLEDFCTNNRVKSVSALVSIIENENSIYGALQHSLQPKFTELFRAPASWEAVETNVFQSVFAKKDSIDILMIGGRSAHEAVSMYIFLDNLGYLDKANITVVCSHADVKEHFSSLIFTEKDLSAIDNNTSKMNLSKPVNDYVHPTGNKFQINSEILEKFNYVQKEIGSGKEIGKFDLVFARDILMYFNNRTHEKMLRWFNYHLDIGQFIVLGVKDSVAWTSSRNSIKEIDVEGRLFKKVRL